MKNIQVIDGALNAAYAIYAATDRDFRLAFPNGQDIEFVEDLRKRLGARRAARLLAKLWSQPISKKKVRGIHGTLFFGLAGVKREFYPTKRELEMIGIPGRSARRTRRR